MLVDDMLSCGKAVKEKVAAQKVKQNQDKVKKAVDSLKPCLEKAASELECNNAILANGIAASAYLSSETVFYCRLEIRWLTHYQLVKMPLMDLLCQRTM